LPLRLLRVGHPLLPKPKLAIWPVSTTRPVVVRMATPETPAFRWFRASTRVVFAPGRVTTRARPASRHCACAA